MKRIRNRPVKRPQNFCKTPYQVQKFTVTEEEKTACLLAVLLNYPLSKAWSIAFQFQGKSSSAPALATRFYQSERIRDYCKMLAEYYGGEPFSPDRRWYR